MNDFDMFLKEMGDVKPLKQDPNAKANIAKSKINDEQAKQRRANAEKLDGGDPNPLTTEAVKMIAPDDLIYYKKSGVQDGVFKNLRLGKYDIHSVLNIQGQSVKEARGKLYQFIKDCHKNDLRSLLIQHGKGMHNQQATLKSYVNQWLRTLDEVKAFHTAQAFHGGYGSVYVLLKKSDEARMTNKERHQKKGANR